MTKISELTARSLSLSELAEALRDHEDPVIRCFATRFLRETEELSETERRLAKENADLSWEVENIKHTIRQISSLVDEAL